MQHFDETTFLALSPAKAKSAALALFDSAVLDPAADWRGVAFALHAVVSRKRGAKVEHIDTQDGADAGEFTAWADYQPTGKGTAIARGRVTIVFADGYSKTVGMLAGKTAKGRKPWSIGPAVRFAVSCYKLGACRRITGSDASLYYDRGGKEAGASVWLGGLIATPEIVSVISADSAETVAGDLVWNPCEANAATLDARAGKVAAPGLMGPHPQHFADALAAARAAMVAEIAPPPQARAMRALAVVAARRVVAALYPVESTFSEREARAQDIAHAFAGLDIADVAPELLPADHDTMLQASAIVKGQTPVEALTLEDFDPIYSALTYADRFRLVEDALLAWPALMVVVEEPAPAASEPEQPAAPPVTARKPRYRFSPISGRWESISDAAPALAA